ncbi:hypothetical protein E2C01_075365 [Portunus trituberculatus]|uniref:Uncharacterized protein n=1 Tax=Portunus trituberculatus TaxID=210409 RepID=A0A5B7IES9_PORTR|nr:hypothetical protein [Portunus trituberculatus]
MKYGRRGLQDDGRHAQKGPIQRQLPPRRALPRNMPDRAGGLVSATYRTLDGGRRGLVEHNRR